MAPAQSTDWSGLSPQLLDGARQMGLAVSPTQAAQLLAYLACLERWNGVHSLSAWTRPTDLMVQHVLDSMTLVGPLERFAQGRPLRILDAGSGPGFPAAVLAAMRPEWHVTAVDAVAKKVAFVRQAAAEAAIGNLVATHSRLEGFHPPRLFDVAVSRAFASLQRFAVVTEHLIGATGVWVAQKGQVPVDELRRLGKVVEVFHVEHVTVPGLAAERNLVWMRRADR